MLERDQVLFGQDPVGISHTLELRQRQVEIKVGAAAGRTPGEKINAKFSPGGLVEVEYAAQFLQLLQKGRLPTNLLVYLILRLLLLGGYSFFLTYLHLYLNRYSCWEI